MDLDRYAFYMELSGEGRQLLAARLGIHRCGPGAPVLQKGAPISGAYFVLTGRLRVYSLAPSGGEATLYFIDPGETCVFALNSLFNDLRYPAWVQATESTEIGFIPGDVYRALFSRESGIQDLTVRALSSLVFRLMGELEEVHAYKLNQRLASLLLMHASSGGIVALTQQRMADHLGTTREVVARLMAEFSGKGWVRSARGRVSLFDVDALERLIHSD